MRLQPAANSNFVGRKQFRDILLSIFFIFEGESERVEVGRVETGEWIVPRNLSTNNPPLAGAKVDVRE